MRLRDGSNGTLHLQSFDVFQLLPDASRELLERLDSDAFKVEVDTSAPRLADLQLSNGFFNCSWRPEQRLSLTANSFDNST
jgi:hypothetical protein